MSLFIVLGPRCIYTGKHLSFPLLCASLDVGGKKIKSAISVQRYMHCIVYAIAIAICRN